MSKRYKYIDDEDFKDDSYHAFCSQFVSREDFDKFYDSLNDCVLKDEFLRIGTSYLFFVKCGDWHVNVPRSNPVIEYFTNSFKVVALLAIIESLSDKEHIDFFQWLSGKENGHEFPITDKSKLQKLYERYKADYGSIRRCKSFFENLPSPTQEMLRNSITRDGEPVQSTKQVVDMIYRVRSGFAHESGIALEISDSVCVSTHNKKEVVWKMPMKYLQTAFEEGVVIYFKNKVIN